MIYISVLHEIRQLYLFLEVNMILLMNSIRRTLLIFTMFLVAMLFLGCGQIVPVPTPTGKTAPGFTPAVPTATISPPTSTPTSSLPISSAPDGLRMAYVIDGNLYFQGGSNPPVQLTKSGDDRYPVFSDDGEKIIFYRGLIPQELYSINIDGTRENLLVTGNLLEALGLGYDKFTEIISLAFVPGTHQILFNTRQLSQADIDQKDFNRLGSKENFDLLSVDTDTGEIKILLPNGKGGSFFISPDASMIAIRAKGHIDIVDVDGQTIRRNLVTYTPTHPYDLRPKIFWNAASTELSVTLPERDIFDMSGPERLLVVRYPLDGSEGVQVAFDPPVLDGIYAVSSDGVWILYFYFYYPGKTDETIPTGFYLGNLQTGESKFYSTGTGIDPPVWSADSRHFVFDYLFLGVVDRSPTSMGDGHFLGWADANHYLYASNGMIVIGDVSGETESFTVDIPQSAVSGRTELFTFHFQDR
jgi:hypothetical protein